MSSASSSFRAGINTLLPVLPGVVPFGLIYGVSAAAAGLPKLPAFFMSPLVFAGAAQLAAVELLAKNAPIFVVVLTGLVINARFLMYGASLGPYFKTITPWERALAAFLLTDQSYVASVARYSREDLDNFHVAAFYFGGALAMYCCWVMSTALGVFLGAAIPASWSLDFAVPLMFIALVFPVIRDAPLWAAAVTAGVTALLFHDLPMNAGLWVAAAAGIAAGFCLEEYKRRCDAEACKG